MAQFSTAGVLHPGVAVNQLRPSSDFVSAVVMCIIALGVIVVVRALAHQ